MVSRRGTGRGGPASFDGPGCLEDLTVQEVFGETTAEGADGTSECPGDSSHEREDAGINSQPWDIQQADKSIRVRNAGERLLPRPRFGSNDLFARGSRTTARVPLTFKRRAGCSPG